MDSTQPPREKIICSIAAPASQVMIGKTFYETAQECLMVWKIFKKVIRFLDGDFRALHDEEIQEDKNELLNYIQIPRAAFIRAASNARQYKAANDFQMEMDTLVANMQDIVRFWFGKLSDEKKNHLQKKRSRKNMISIVTKYEKDNKERLNDLYKNTTKDLAGISIRERQRASKDPDQTKMKKLSHSMPNLPRIRRSHKRLDELLDPREPRDLFDYEDCTPPPVVSEAVIPEPPQTGVTQKKQDSEEILFDPFSMDFSPRREKRDPLIDLGD
jgi:hypothetical protein